MPEYSPTFIKVDPATGLTFYDFEGHVKAEGLDLASGSAADPNTLITWTDTDGHKVARINGVRGGNQRMLGLQAGDETHSWMALSLITDDASKAATMCLLSIDPPPNMGPQIGRKLLDANGDSDLLADAEWNIPSYGSWWSDFGGGWRSLRWRRLNQRTIQLLGMARVGFAFAGNNGAGPGTGTRALICGELPAPAAHTMSTAIVEGPSNEDGIARLDLYTNGELYYARTQVGNITGQADTWVNVDMVYTTHAAS